jgi:ADP-ribosylglycohydrolase
VTDELDAASYRDRIAAALTTYACGDAFGVPWEGADSADIDLGTAATLPVRPGRPRGATSDDTALTLLVAEVLTTTSNEDPGSRFLRLLSERAETVPGLGPSTLAAIRAFRESGRRPETGGDTNGAAMRALPAGWAVPVDEPDRRRALSLGLSRVTHPSPDAQCAAAVISACASWSLEGADAQRLLEVARDEARIATGEFGGGRRLGDLLAAVATDRWSAAPSGVSLEPYDTVAAVLHCIVTARSPIDAMRAAVALGGDTDTVAALAGGLLGAGFPSAEAALTQIPWSSAVLLPDAAVVTGFATGLAAARAAGR